MPLSFPHVVPESFGDVTLDLEYLRSLLLGGDLSGTLPSPTVATVGGKAQASGTGTFVFTASTSSAVVTITHGLGRTPTVVLLTPQNAVAVGVSPAYGSPGATTFPAIAYTAAAQTVSVPFSWLVFG